MQSKRSPITVRAHLLPVLISTRRVKIEHLKIRPNVRWRCRLQMMGDAENKGVFLSAEWRHLAMLNWPVERDVLQPHVPAGTELDLWAGQPYCSVIGFMFLKTRIMGVPIPLHQSFPEVNLRFYVRRKFGDQWRRAAVFVRELVPKRMVAWIARGLFNEQYSYCPMSYDIDRDSGGVIQRLQFGWRLAGSPGSLELRTEQVPQPMAEGSEQQYIAEHYWGYARQPDGGTKEYRVRHPSWNVCDASSARLDVDVAHLYGDRFVDVLSHEPTSAFLADGSAVTVSHGVRIA